VNGASLVVAALRSRDGASNGLLKCVVSETLGGRVLRLAKSGSGLTEWATEPDPFFVEPIPAPAQ